MDLDQFESRKRDHIHLALRPENQAVGFSGLDSVHLAHDALPEVDLHQIQLRSVRLGQESPNPFTISGMTAGHADAVWLNSVLAEAAQEHGWAMGVGSQRRDLQGGEGSPDSWKDFRKRFPRLTLYANLGITQLATASIESVKRIMDSLGANALVVHANALQEALQPEGTPFFKGAVGALASLCKIADFPIVLKETGCGFSPHALKKLSEVGLAAIDVSGLGGTHWGRIEGARASRAKIQARASQTFSGWGESTVDSVLAVRAVLPDTEIWASGGVRTGLDAAKLVALGASQVGFAQPVLKAVQSVERDQAPQSLRDWMELIEFEFRLALFCTGCASTKELRQKEGVWRIKP